MADELTVQPAAEFQALPLEYFISAPLTAAVKAQAVAAHTTLEFVSGLMDPKTKKPQTTDFSVSVTGADGKPKQVTIRAPLLSLVPIPHVRIDSMTIHFKYEISQTWRSQEAHEKGVEFGAETGKLLSPWVKATLKGSVSSKSSEEATANRSGVLEITVHASEAAMPEGLAKILTVLSRSIETPA